MSRRIRVNGCRTMCGGTFWLDKSVNINFTFGWKNEKC